MTVISTMKKVCSWCGLVIARGTDANAPVTHSICPGCIEKVDAEIEARERSKLTP